MLPQHFHFILAHPQQLRHYFIRLSSHIRATSCQPVRLMAFKTITSMITSRHFVTFNPIRKSRGFSDVLFISHVQMLTTPTSSQHRLT